MRSFRKVHDSAEPHQPSTPTASTRKYTEPKDWFCPYKECGYTSLRREHLLRHIKEEHVSYLHPQRTDTVMCRTCGGENGGHVPSILDPKGTAHPNHNVEAQDIHKGKSRRANDVPAQASQS